MLLEAWELASPWLALHPLDQALWREGMIRLARKVEVPYPASDQRHQTSEEDGKVGARSLHFEDSLEASLLLTPAEP